MSDGCASAFSTSGYKKKSLLSLPARSELEDIEAQLYYHSLFSGKKEYRKLWNYLDDLWHRYRLDQMYQVIQFGREAKKWNAKLSVTEDKLLEDLLNAAYAWMLHSSDKFEKAVEFAKKVTKSPHRRLRATANIVLGFIDQNPKKAIRYLNIAKKLYEQLKHDLEKNRLKKNEFYDQLIDVYQELHLCLLKIGEIRWQHFFNLEEGEVVLEEALKLTKEDAWVSKSPYVPLYEATALNSLARIYRFRGMFGEASRMVLRAIVLLNQNGDPGLTYEWSPATLFSNPAIPSPTLITNDDVQIKVKITDPNNVNCFAEKTINVIMELMPLLMPFPTPLKLVPEEKLLQFRRKSHI